MKISINEARAEKPRLMVGKNGITDGLLEEIRDCIKKEGYIKVKAIPSAYGSLDRKEFFKTLADEGDFKLVEVRGHTAILGKV